MSAFFRTLALKRGFEEREYRSASVWVLWLLAGLIAERVAVLIAGLIFLSTR